MLFCFCGCFIQSFEHCDYLDCEEIAHLSVFCTFVRFLPVWFCLFSLPLGVLEELRLVIVALLGHLFYLFLTSLSHI